MTFIKAEKQESLIIELNQQVSELDTTISILQTEIDIRDRKIVKVRKNVVKSFAIGLFIGIITTILI